MVKPSKLQHGDTIGVVSPSWGGPNVFPHVYELGLQRLKEVFGLKIKEFPNTKQDPDFIRKNPKARAKDIK